MSFPRKRESRAPARARPSLDARFRGHDTDVSGSAWPPANGQAGRRQREREISFRIFRKRSIIILLNSSRRNRMLETRETAPPAPRHSRRAARQAKASRESRIVEALNRGVSLADIAEREHVGENRMRALVHEILKWRRLGDCRPTRYGGRRFGGPRPGRPNGRSGRDADRRLLLHIYAVDYYIILCDEAVESAGASGSDFARNCLRESIPLLFRCYSAVNSAVNSAVIPLLFCCQRRQFIPQIPETAKVFRGDCRKRRQHRIFFSH